MDQQKALSLLNRQLEDIQVQADKILRGDNSSEAIEAFSKYSEELKKFIVEKTGKQELASIAADIVKVNYKRNEVAIWQYLILPAWWISIYKDYHARNECLHEIRDVKGKYASLQMYLRMMRN